MGCWGEEKVNVLSQLIKHFHSVYLTSICSVLDCLTPSLPVLLIKMGRGKGRGEKVSHFPWSLVSLRMCYEVNWTYNLLLSYFPSYLSHHRVVWGSKSLCETQMLTHVFLPCCHGWVDMNGGSVSWTAWPSGRSMSIVSGLALVAKGLASYLFPLHLSSFPCQCDCNALSDRVVWTINTMTRTVAGTQ